MLHAEANASLPAVSEAAWRRAVSRYLPVLVCCAVLLAWSVVDQRFRDTQGFLQADFVVPIALAAAVAALGVGVNTGHVRVAAWFSLAVLGQAVALQLIDAGPLLHFQHYRAIAAMPPGALAFLGFQTISVAVGIARQRSSIWTWLMRHFAWWQLLAIGATLVVTSAALSRDLSSYATELAFASLVEVVNLGTIVLLVLAIPPSTAASLARAADRLLAAEDERSGNSTGIDRVALGAGIVVTLAAAGLSILSYERHPHIPDEVAYMFQARYFAAGLLTMPLPSVPAAFDVDLMMYQATRWFSPVQPGWPAVLAIGARFGAAWLVNPVLAGVNVLLSFSVVRELYDRRTARLTVLLLTVSPWFVFMGMNFMTHMVTMTFALGATVLVARSRRTDQTRWAWLAGVLLGCGALVRQLDGLIAAVLVGLWAIGIGGRRLKWTSVAALVIGTAALAALYLPYNQFLVGNPTAFPLEMYLDQLYGKGSNAIGFGPNRGLGWALQAFPGHTPLNALANAVLNAFSVNIELFGWSVGSVLVIAAFIFSGAVRRRDLCMFGAIAMVVGAYSLYWYHGGPDFGARYWFLILLPCVVVAARGIQALTSSIQRSPLVDAGRGRMVASILALSVITVLAYFPWRAVDKYHHYELMSPDILGLAQQYRFGNSLVLIRGDRYPDYMSTAAYNPVDLGSVGPIYAWDRDPAVRAEVVGAYSDRPIWIVDGPTLTHAGYEVVAGPLSATDVLTGSIDTP